MSIVRRLLSRSSVAGAQLAVWHWQPQRQPGSVTRRCRGLVLDLDLEDNLQATLAAVGTYDAPLLRLLLSTLQPDDVVLDVGANIGWMVLNVAAELRALGGTGRVHAVEPASDTFSALVHNIRRNGLGARVHAHRLALGSETGYVDLRAAAEDALGDVGRRSLDGSGALIERVEVVPLDVALDRLSLERLDIVKIDVEGAEESVIAGMSQTLQRLRPRMVVVELWHGASGPAHDRLLEAGYEVVGRVAALPWRSDATGDQPGNFHYRAVSDA